MWSPANASPATEQGKKAQSVEAQSISLIMWLNDHQKAVAFFAEESLSFYACYKRSFFDKN